VPSIMVGLLAAIATAMPALIPFAHGYLIVVLILEAAAAAGLVAICAAPDQRAPAVEAAGSDQKKNLLKTDNSALSRFSMASLLVLRRFAARLSGLASGLAAH
jgi:hypothetical protein